MERNNKQFDWWKLVLKEFNDFRDNPTMYVDLHTTDFSKLLFTSECFLSVALYFDLPSFSYERHQYPSQSDDNGSNNLPSRWANKICKTVN